MIVWFMNECKGAAQTPENIEPYTAISFLILWRFVVLNIIFKRLILIEAYQTIIKIHDIN